MFQAASSAKCGTAANTLLHGAHCGDFACATGMAIG
jgi:hypothetical protein